MPICVTTRLPAGKLSQLPRFVKVMGQRLLAIDVLAQLQRAHGDRRVHVVGGGDIHRVYALAFLIEQLAPVLVDSCAGKVLLELGGAPQVHLGHGHQLHLLEFRELPDVLPGHAGGPEAGVAQHAAGRPGDQVARDEGRRQSSGAEGLKERTAGEGTTGRMSS